ncbi:MAG: hypothetical protein HXX11_12130 [Desulfuromonadales bacterium]|nr:hypothetical protein [Desulfuromonadales bacterium]
MKKTLLVKMAIMALTISALSGCLWVPVDDGYNRGDSHGRDRGEHRGEHHERQDDRGDHR